jgi:hypothetical protein
LRQPLITVFRIDSVPDPLRRPRTRMPLPAEPEVARAMIPAWSMRLSPAAGVMSRPVSSPVIRVRAISTT